MSSSRQRTQNTSTIQQTDNRVAAAENAIAIGSGGSFTDNSSTIIQSLDAEVAKASVNATRDVATKGFSSLEKISGDAIIQSSKNLEESLDFADDNVNSVLDFAKVSNAQAINSINDASERIFASTKNSDERISRLLIFGFVSLGGIYFVSSIFKK